MTERTAEAIRALKAEAGARVARLHIVCDGSDRDHQVPKTRNKWQKLARVLDQYDWHTVEAFDAKGDLLTTITDEPDDDDERDDDAGYLRAVTAVNRLMLHSQDVALKRQAEGQQQLLESSVKLLEVLTQRVVALEKATQQQLETIRKLMMEAAGEGDSQSMAESMMAMVLPGLVRGQLGAAVANASNPNGQKKGA